MSEAENVTATTTTTNNVNNNNVEHTELCIEHEHDVTYVHPDNGAPSTEPTKIWVPKVLVPSIVESTINDNDDDDNTDDEENNNNNKIVSVQDIDMMDWVGRSTTKVGQDLILEKRDIWSTPTEKSSRAALIQMLQDQCKDFKLSCKGWETSQGKPRIRFICARGRRSQTKDKKRAGVRPTEHADVCRFNFTFYWSEELGWYLKGGSGNRFHNGHYPICTICKDKNIIMEPPPHKKIKVEHNKDVVEEDDTPAASVEIAAATTTTSEIVDVAVTELQPVVAVDNDNAQQEPQQQQQSQEEEEEPQQQQEQEQTTLNTNDNDNNTNITTTNDNNNNNLETLSLYRTLHPVFIEMCRSADRNNKVASILRKGLTKIQTDIRQIEGNSININSNNDGVVLAEEGGNNNNINSNNNGKVEPQTTTTTTVAEKNNNNNETLTSVAV